MKRTHSFLGFSMIEVLVALAILGILSVAFLQTTRYAQQNTGKSMDWQAEATAVEKAVENLRVGHTIARLQTIDSSWVDASQGKLRIQVRAVGSLPPDAVATGFTPDRIAQIRVTARRTTYNDSLTVTTYIWVN